MKIKEIKIQQLTNELEQSVNSPYIDEKRKLEILTQIKAELLNCCNNISIIELEMLSNNIYECCCLIIHQCTEDEILKYILYKNTHYYNKLTDEDKKKETLKINYEILKNLTDKYIKIIKSNKQS